MSAGVIPSRRYMPIPAPAEVPTTTSAAAGSQPLASAMAASTPAWKAWPVRPPAPSTNPMEGIGSFWSPATRFRCRFPTEIFGGESRVDRHEEPFGLGGEHAVDPQLALADDATTLDPIHAPVQLDRPVQRRRLEVPDSESAGHPRVPGRDVGHAEELVEGERDAAAVYVAGRTLVGGMERAPHVQTVVVGGPRHRWRDRAHDADERRAAEVVGVAVLGSPAHPAVIGVRLATQVTCDGLGHVGRGAQLLLGRVLDRERRVDEVAHRLGEPLALRRDERVGRPVLVAHYLPLNSGGRFSANAR